MGGVAVPGMAKGEGGLGLATVLVARAADVEVGPLANVVGAVDARCIGLKKVRLVERGAVGDAGEDDEEEEEEGCGHEDEAD